MFFSVALYTSLAIFLLGLIYKVSNWFRYDHGNIAASTLSVRLWAFIKAFLAVICSRRILILFKTLIVDVFFQIRILRESPLRWISHMFICWGFIFLLLFHALDHFTLNRWVAPYYPTLNPFLFLRNLFGALVLVGMLLAVYRRFLLRKSPPLTNAMDKYILVLLAVVFLSGILLETARLTSRTEFAFMVADYAGLEEAYDKEEIENLESYWVQEFGLVSARVGRPFDADALEAGKASHEMFCAECHSSYKWAFMSYGTSKAIGSTLALKLDKERVISSLWYLHILSCFIGLAYLPFSKMFHVITSPISLLANAVTDSRKSHPLNIATRQAMELDACTHCGACSMRCAVGIASDLISNVYVLPSEKISAAKAILAGRKLSEQELATIVNGFYFCVNCNRCTEVCPAGINLQELWFATREALLQRDISAYYMLSNLSFPRGLNRGAISEGAYHRPLARLHKEVAGEYKRIDQQDGSMSLSHYDNGHKGRLSLSLQGETSSSCFTCTTCSLVCPVVENFPNPRQALGLLPHQVVHAANLGLLNLAFCSDMLWSCLGCYECQDSCPQGVKVTDVFFELKNIAMDSFNQSVLGHGRG
jgi:heterodisulfide reductase subunit C/nitrate reductase gamma subunit